MKDETFRIITNENIAKDIYRMELEGDASDISAPGQFVDIALKGKYLRRPISVCDWTDGSLTLIYKVVGEGTGLMSDMGAGDELNILIPLGNGFDLDHIPEDAALIAGGVGVPPIYGLAKRLVEQGIRPSVYLGFKNSDEVYMVDEFKALDLYPEVDIGGFVTDMMPMGAYVCTCGPEPMLKAVWQKAAAGQFSLEARMGCGFGACMGCTCKTTGGFRQICKDGPVLMKDDIIWE